MDQTFSNQGRINGSVDTPGDKSISHRAAILAAMASGKSAITGVAPGGDVASTLACLQSLGYLAVVDNAILQIEGDGWQVEGDHELDAGNSGTTMRLLAGALAGRPGRFTINGDRSLSARPMARIAEPLRQMGASISLSESDTPPVIVEGASLTGIDYRLPVASAQVKGSILLAGLQAAGETAVTETVASRDHTERLLKWLGAPVVSGAGTVRIKSGDASVSFPGFELEVPGDFSSAAFWLVAAILMPLSQVRIENVGLNPTRTGLLTVLEKMGACFTTEISAEDPEPVGSIECSFSRLEAAEIPKGLIPAMIDELPVLALAATQAEGQTSIRGAAELRAKESDRIAGLAAGLSVLGARVQELPDGLLIDGPMPLGGGVVDCLGDHRLAMTFAIAGLIAAEPVTVKRWEATAVSYPDFEADLKALVDG